MARHCTMPDGPEASFTSSNSQLDAVWDLCARSALYTTHEQFVDTPTREKGQFLWDSCNESQVILRAHAESNLSFQALRDFARSQKRFWPDGRVSDIYPTGYGAQSYVSFTALYPEWVWRYYLSTGDVAGTDDVVPGPRTPLGLPVATGAREDRARYGRAARAECGQQLRLRLQHGVRHVDQRAVLPTRSPGSLSSQMRSAMRGALRPMGRERRSSPTP